MLRRVRTWALAALFFAFVGLPLGGNPSGLSSLAFMGLSGKLRAVFTLPTEKTLADLPAAPRQPGVYPLSGVAPALEKFSLVVLTPFSAKVNGRIGAYRMGTWPYEQRP